MKMKMFVRSRTLLLLTLLAVATSELSAQQTRTVTGRVVSAETLQPMPGVSISIEGRSAGTLSGPDGSYTVQVPANGRLVFTFLGHQPHREAVGERSVIDVQLVPAEVSAGDIEVVGYAAPYYSPPARTYSLPAQTYSLPTHTYSPSSATYSRGIATPAEPVTYTISGLLEDIDPYELPIQIVTALQGDTHLRGMSLNSPGARTADLFYFNTADSKGRPSFEAAFGFATLEEFHTWYGERGTELHRAIERTAAQDFRFNLSVVPVEP